MFGNHIIAQEKEELKAHKKLCRNSFQVPQNYYCKNTLAVTKLNWLERRGSDRKVPGSMPVLGIMSLCPWERHFTLIS